MNLEEFRKIYLKVVILCAVIGFLFLITTGIEHQGIKSSAQFLVLLFSIQLILKSKII